MVYLFILMAAAIAYILVRNKMRATTRHPVVITARKYVPDLPATAPALHWSDEGRYASEVENESAYQDTIRQLAGEHGEKNADTRYLAILLPDDNNPYQDKAVAVFINTRLVGYLAHSDALRLRRKLGRKDIVGQPTSCDAAIRGGGAWNGKRLSYAVWLDVQPFD